MREITGSVQLSHPAVVRRSAKTDERRAVDLPDPGATEPLPLGQLLERKELPAKAESAFENATLPRRKVVEHRLSHCVSESSERGKPIDNADFSADGRELVIHYEDGSTDRKPLPE